MQAAGRSAWQGRAGPLSGGCAHTQTDPVCEVEPRWECSPAWHSLPDWGRSAGLPMDPCSHGQECLHTLHGSSSA